MCGGGTALVGRSRAVGCRRRAGVLLIVVIAVSLGGLDGAASVLRHLVGAHGETGWIGQVQARSRSERNERHFDRGEDRSHAAPPPVQTAPPPPVQTAPAPGSGPGPSDDRGGPSQSGGDRADSSPRGDDPGAPQPASAAVTGTTPAPAGGVAPRGVVTDHHTPRTMAEVWGRLKSWLGPEPSAPPRAAAPPPGQIRSPQDPAPHRHESGRGATSGEGDRHEHARHGNGADRISRSGRVDGRHDGHRGHHDGRLDGRRQKPDDGRAVILPGTGDKPEGTDKGGADEAAPSRTGLAKPAKPPPPAVTPPPGTYVPGRIVALGTLSDADLAKLKARGFGVGPAQHNGPLGSSTMLTLPPGLDAAEAIDFVNRQTAAAYVGFDRLYGPFKPEAGLATDAPRDVGPLAPGACPPSRCFGMQAVAWHPRLADCARSVSIGLIDTAVDRGHPAFAHDRLRMRDFRSGAPASDWHGTGVLALLAGDSQSGTPGLVPDTSIYVADVFSADARGQPITDTQALVAALGWMAGNGVKVINMSLAGPRDPLMEPVVKALAAQGIVIVAAAGNAGPAAAPLYPAAYDDVIAVTAVDRDLRNYRYANRGPHIDVAAPGVDVWTAVPGQRGGLDTGTSFAAPYVTAMVAAVYPRAPAKTKAAVLDAVPTRDLGPPGRDPVYGRGLVQGPATCEPEPVTAWGAVATPGDTAQPVPASLSTRDGAPVALPASLPGSAPAPVPPSLSFAPSGSR